MRRHPVTAVMAMVVLGACSDSTGLWIVPSDGGSTSSSCGTFTACGGDVTGTWSFKGLCGKSGPASFLCADATSDFSGFTSTVTFNADGTFASSPSNSWTAHIPTSCFGRDGGVPVSCSQINATNVVCTDGATECTCKVSNMGLLPPSGRYSTSGNQLTLVVGGGSSTVPYCVMGGSLRYYATAGSVIIDAIFTR
jgi:hypothetical protein